MSRISWENSATRQHSKIELAFDIVVICFNTRVHTFLHMFLKTGLAELLIKNCPKEPLR